jgi:hypothetical protein
MADPIRRQALLEAYSEWLFNERRLLCLEFYPDDPNAEKFVPTTPAARFHFPSNGDWKSVPAPSTRARKVLAAAGVTVDRLLRNAGITS